MTYHIVLNRPTDLDGMMASAAQGCGPRHSMALLAKRLNASIHDGHGLAPSRLDRLLAAVTRTKPLWWTIARRVRQHSRAGDVIFCTGEDIGTPIALLCGGRAGRHVAVMFHHIARAKGKLALRLLRLGRNSALLLAVSRPQIDFLRSYLGYDEDRVRFITDQTDTHFFKPRSAQSIAKSARPIVMSVGLEQRDYSTLAAATSDLPIDVRISGYSADTKTMAKAFPPELPANMTRKFYPWGELQQLYQDADVAVVSLFPNTHAAGVQALMEAMACGKPTVVTATAGLEGYLEAGDALRVVPAGDIAAMREAIKWLLDNSDARNAAGQLACSTAHNFYALERYVDDLACALENLALAKQNSV